MKLSLHADELDCCTYCPKLCRFCCPTAQVESKETVTPWGKMTIAQFIQSAALEPDAENTEVFLHCFGCLHCQEYCLHDNNVPEALFAGRADALDVGSEMPQVTSLLDRFRDTGNPFGDELHQALSQAVDGRYFVREAQVALFAGCRAIQNAHKHIQPVIGLLEAIGIDYVGMHNRELLCCGAPLWQAGDRFGFAQHARRLARQFGSLRKLICLCPTCAHVLGSLFTLVDVHAATQIVTLDAFLEPLLTHRKPQRKIDEKVVYHDPCYLARYLRRTQQVRDLLASVTSEPLLEATWKGRDAICCGGGGLVPLTLPQVAADAASLRMKQLKETGAQLVASACPGCVGQLSQVGDALPVKDYVQLLCQAYE